MTRMKGLARLEAALGNMRKGNMVGLLDKLSFVHILAIWVCIVIAFGCVYGFLQNETSYLSYSNKITGGTGSHVENIRDAVYFSFVTATTTGFGDITPVGLFKIVSVFEVVCALLLVALVTSKLVSVKQDIILGELYDLSLNEKINRIRSSLLLFRQNLDRLATRIESREMRRRELTSLHSYFAPLEDILGEVHALMGRRRPESHFLKNVDPVSAELIYHSILSSFDKLGELAAVMDQHRIPWRTADATGVVSRCLSVTESIFGRLDVSGVSLVKEKVADLHSRKAKVSALVKGTLEKAASMPDSAGLGRCARPA